MPELYEIRNGYVADIWEQTEGDLFRSSRDKHSLASYSLLKRMKNSGFVFGGAPAASQGSGQQSPVPAPRFSSLKEAAKHLFSIEPYGEDQFLIRNVPIYKTHGDTRGNKHVSDRKFLDRMVKNFYATLEATKNLFGDSSYAWLPKFHIGHTPNNPDLPERPNAGFWKELFRVEDFLFGDLVVDKNGMESLLSGNYPDRSAEVDIKRGRLLSVAALGFRTPHFALPQMRPDVLRKKYKELIQKHAFSDSIRHFITLGEELPMAKTKTKSRQRETLSPSVVARFFMSLQCNEELNEKYEALKDELIQKHMEKNGGTAPNMADLQQIIMQVIQQMMSQQMNQAPPAGAGPGGMMFNSSDALDFESSVHHGASDQDLNEEGTDVAGEGDPAGLRKVKRSDDTDVDDMGYPTETEDDVEGDNDIVTTDGKVKSRNDLELDTDEVVKNALKDIPGDFRKQIEPVIKKVTAPLKQLGQIINRQHHAIKSLQAQAEKSKFEKREAVYRSRLMSMFQAGNAAVNSKERLEKHLKFALKLEEKEANEYLANLEEIPPLSGSKIVRHSREAIKNPASMSQEEIMRHRYETELDRETRKHVPFDVWKATELLDTLYSGEE
ncbi:MAG TPA: hypothetical protein PKU94_08315 [Candidatus Hydrothermia bacterium]|nr:hypothetical protein [Candidatus Hydrothermia bacterium]